MKNSISISSLISKANRGLGLAVIGVAMIGFTSAAGEVDTAPTFTSQGVYSEAQADAGQSAYTGLGCNTCHGSVLEGSFGPGLRGSAFQNKWTGSKVEELVQFIWANMPPTEPRTLDHNDIIDIVAHILRTNGFPAAEDAELDEISLESLYFGEATE